MDKKGGGGEMFKIGKPGALPDLTLRKRKESIGRLFFPLRVVPAQGGEDLRALSFIYCFSEAMPGPHWSTTSRAGGKSVKPQIEVICVSPLALASSAGARAPTPVPGDW